MRVGANARGDEAAQSGVVGRIEVHHVSSERRAGESGVDDVGIVVERGDQVLRQPLIVEGLAGGIVPEDEPGVVTVGELHALHRALGSRRLEQRIRIVARRRRPRRPTS